MVRRRHRTRRDYSERKKGARKAVEHLSSVLVDCMYSDSEISDNAARQLIRIGRKHGIRPNSHVRRLICRTCRRSLMPGKSARVRVYSRVVSTTCLRCGRVHKSGPNFKGRS